VGATLRGTSANSMASFSSGGPTADGRIKPETTVPGSNIVSARNDGRVTTNNCTTLTESGTSMASPGAAGFTALIRQYYTAGWYPTGGAVSTNGFTPSAALLRATLVNSAVSMTGTTAIPANCQGWGRVLLENALYFTGQTRKLWIKDTATPFATGSVNEDRAYSFTVTTGEALKVTLAWTDFPSTPAASPNLNNDLDLIVTGPTGTVWRGNVFSGGNSATGGAADRRNTLEQVLLASPAAGTYTVTVRSFNVPNGPQPFALVVTGNVVGP
jgi:Subtilase family